MSIPTNALPWHPPYWRLLHAYLLQERVPQALMINGMPGLGKRTLALHFAQALLCQQRTTEGFACHHCHACLLFNAETHPDLLIVQPETADNGQEQGNGAISRKPGTPKNIGIDKIRALLPLLALKPYGQNFRVVLIDGAECLNTAAANAFLKCLEEPNERTVILLTTADRGRLPATIRSRCQQLYLMAPAHQQASDWLTQQGVQGDHGVLLNLAQGAPLLALQYAQENVVALRNSCFNEWLQIAKQQSNPVSIAEHWQKLPLPPLLKWLTSWAADLIKGRYHSSSPDFLNPDLQPRLQELQKQLDLKALFAWYDELLSTQRQLHTQLNKQLLLEVILIHWSNLNCRA